MWLLWKIPPLNADLVVLPQSSRQRLWSYMVPGDTEAGRWSQARHWGRGEPSHREKEPALAGALFPWTGQTPRLGHLVSFCSFLSLLPQTPASSHQAPTCCLLSWELLSFVSSRSWLPFLLTGMNPSWVRSVSLAAPLLPVLARVAGTGVSWAQLRLFDLFPLGVPACLLPPAPRPLSPVPECPSLVYYFLLQSLHCCFIAAGSVPQALPLLADKVHSFG